MLGAVCSARGRPACPVCPPRAACASRCAARAPRRGGWSPLRDACACPCALPRCAALSCRAVAAVPGCISSLQSSPASLCNGLCSALCPAAALAFFRGRAHAHTHAPLEDLARAPPPALCGRVPQAIAGLCAVQERRAGWSPRAAAAGRRGTGLGRAAGRGARRGARLEAVSAGPPGAAARRCPAGQPRGWRPAAGVPLVLARRALAPGPVG